MVRYKLSWVLVIFIIVSLLTGISWGESDGVRLTIKERAGINWRNHPITIGFPVPPDSKEFFTPPKVVDAWNNEIPSQAVLSGKWPQKGTPRWWLITFLGSVNQRGSSEYRIVPGGEELLTPRRPVELRQEGEEFLLDNGYLRMAIPTSNSFVNEIWFTPSGRVSSSEHDLAQKSIRLLMRTERGRFEGKNSQLKVLEKGPVRTVVSLEGEFYHTETNQTNGFIYQGHLVVYGDSPFINLDLSLINEGLTDWTEVKGAWLEFQQSEGNIRKSLEAAIGYGEKGGAEIRLAPEDQASIGVFGPEELKWGGKAVSLPHPQNLDLNDLGWVDLTGVDFGMTIGVADFWQQYPKVLRVRGCGKTEVELAPQTSALVWGRGVAKTHKLTVLFHSNRDRNYTEQMAGLLNLPPTPSLPVSWYNRTGVFFNPLRTAGGDYSEEMMIAATFLGEKSKGDFLNLFGPAELGQEVNKRNWGFFNYGDLQSGFSPPWVVKGEYWNNNQYDLPLLLFREFLETQEAVFLDLAHDSLLHLSDVDLAHPSAGDRISPGLDHIRSYKTGLLAEAEDFSYVKNRGLLLGYYLLGNYRFFELAVKVANRVCLVDGQNPDRPRSYGLGINGALTGYEATGEDKYLLRAKELAADLGELIREKQGNIPSDFVYQVGICLEGLLQLNRWHNDPELMESVKIVVDRVIYDFWDAEKGLIQNLGGLTLTRALYELYLSTGDETYWEICRSQFGKFLDSVEVLDAREVALSYRNLYTVLSMKNGEKMGKD